MATFHQVEHILRTFRQCLLFVETIGDVLRKPCEYGVVQFVTLFTAQVLDDAPLAAPGRHLGPVLREVRGVVQVRITQKRSRVREHLREHRVPRHRADVAL